MKMSVLCSSFGCRGRRRQRRTRSGERVCGRRRRDARPSGAGSAPPASVPTPPTTLAAAAAAAAQHPFLRGSAGASAATAIRWLVSGLPEPIRLRPSAIGVAAERRTPPLRHRSLAEAGLTHAFGPLATQHPAARESPATTTTVSVATPTTTKTRDEDTRPNRARHDVEVSFLTVRE